MNGIGTANDKVPLSAAYVAEGTYPADICVLRYALERNARAKRTIVCGISYESNRDIRTTSTIEG